MRRITPASRQTHSAIEMLYHAHHGALLAHLTRLVSDRMAAEDLCQETCLKALRGWSEAEILNSSAWLYRIATNTAYDYLRRRKRIQFDSISEAAEPIASAEAMEARIGEQEPVRRVLAQLPADARRLLVLSSCAGHSTREIAAALDCSDSAVRLRLFRARERFRKIYLKLCMN